MITFFKELDMRNGFKQSNFSPLHIQNEYNG